MKSKIYTLYIYLIIATFFVGCKGCSCNLPKTYVLDSHIEELTLETGDTARVRIELLERTGAGFTFKFKQHNTGSSHSVSYDLQINDRPYREFVYEHDADGTDSIQQHCKELTVEMSPDKMHVLVKHQKDVVGVYHLLPQGMPFTTAKKEADVNALAKSFAQNTLGNPTDIMAEYIKQIWTGEKAQTTDDRYTAATLGAQGFTPLDDILLNYMGIPLVDSFYSQSRIFTLSTKKLEWLKKAVEKTNKSIALAVTAKPSVSKELLLAANGAVNLYKKGLSEAMEKYSMETLVLQKYPLYDFSITLYDMDPHRSLRKTIAQKVRANSKAILNDAALRESLPDSKISVDAAILFLVNYRDDKNTAEFDAVMASIFSKDIAKLKPRNLNDEILFPYDTRFSEEEQKIILAHAQRLQKELPKDANYAELDFFFKKISRES